MAETMRGIDVTGLFGKKQTAKVGALTIILHQDNDQKHLPLGHVERPKGWAPAPGEAAEEVAGAVHWSAGTYNAVFDGYHAQCVYDPAAKKAYIVKCLDWGQKAQHLWGRNSGFYAFSFAAMHGASPRHFGKYPVTPEQLELMAQFIAEFYAWKRINPAKAITVAKKQSNDHAIWTVPGQVVIPPLVDHGTMARHDQYGEHRWDVGTYFPKLSARVMEIYRELKGVKMPNGQTRRFEFEELLK